jgi:hypothetical protein
MAGCIAIQGQSNSDAEQPSRVILFNVEQFPSRTWQHIFPWTSTVAERTASSPRSMAAPSTPR